MFGFFFGNVFIPEGKQKPPHEERLGNSEIKEMPLALEPLPPFHLINRSFDIAA